MSMSKRTRWLLLIGGLAVVAAVGLQLLYSGMHHVPAFYREAVAADPHEEEAASKVMLQQTAQLANAFQRKGEWESLFTAKQVNGWLAVDLVRNHPQALPPIFRNPRVEITADHVTVAGLLKTDHYWSVVSLTVEPSLPEPNVLALRLRNARAGLLPVPQRKILDALTQLAKQLHWRLEWRQADGDPVALLTLPTDPEGKGRCVRLETLRLGAGEIYLAGTTNKAK